MPTTITRGPLTDTLTELPITGREVPAFPALRVRKLREFQTLDGGGYLGEVYDADSGQRIGDVEDGGHGGGGWFRQDNAEAGASFDAFVAAVPSWTETFAGLPPLEMKGHEAVVSALVQEAALEKKLVGLFRRGKTTAFLLPGDDRTVEYRTVNAPYDRAVEYLRRDKPEALVFDGATYVPVNPTPENEESDLMPKTLNKPGLTADEQREAAKQKQRDRMARLRAERKAEKQTQATVVVAGVEVPRATQTGPNTFALDGAIDESDTFGAALAQVQAEAPAPKKAAAKKAPAKKATARKAVAAKADVKKRTAKATADKPAVARLAPGEAPAPEVGEEAFHCPKCGKTVGIKYKAAGRNACKPCYNRAFAEWKAKQAATA